MKPRSNFRNLLASITENSLSQNRKDLDILLKNKFSTVTKADSFIKMDLVNPNNKIHKLFHIENQEGILNYLLLLIELPKDEYLDDNFKVKFIIPLHEVSNKNRSFNNLIDAKVFYHKLFTQLKSETR